MWCQNNFEYRCQRLRPMHLTVPIYYEGEARAVKRSAIEFGPHVFSSLPLSSLPS